MKKSHLTAAEAAAELGITTATLYSYVSRGLIRSEAAGGDPRARRYSAEDVERLKAKKESRRDPEIVAETALHLGMPVLESSITLIDDGRLYYRGLDAVELALNHSIEQVAALLWTGDLNADTSAWFGAPFSLPARCEGALPAIAHLPPFETFQVMLPLAAVDDFAAYDLRPEAVAATGSRIVRLLLGLAAGDCEGGLAKSLANGWGVPDAAYLINAALILCADHELNVSAFTARCIASSGATLYAAVSGGLAALGGPKHGGHTERVEALLREAQTPEGVQSALTGRLRRGESIPGFGHMLYPDRDPRGQALMDLLMTHFPDSETAAFIAALERAGAALLNEQPTIDMGLVLLTRALDLPRGAALAMFAIGRTIGWVGHVMEQYALDKLIRPRARYTGVQPLTGK